MNMETKYGWNLWHGHGERTGNMKDKGNHEFISIINLDKRVNN